jgi:hypothetical protein
LYVTTMGVLSGHVTIAIYRPLWYSYLSEIT